MYAYKMPEPIFTVNRPMHLKTIWANEINQGVTVDLDDLTVLYVKDNIIAAAPPEFLGLYEFFKKMGTPQAVISELCVHTDASLSPVPIYSVPFRCMEILPINFLAQKQPVELITDYCFSFAVKKKTVHRHLLLKLIEYFQLTSYDGTYDANWRDFDLARILEEISQGNYTSQFQTEITSPIKLSKRWIDSPTDMIKVWESGLDKICQRSAVHIINETISWEKSSQFGEKTLHAILGLNFPLWVGGYGQAQAFQRLGFDAFTDVIDHSYQYYPRLIDRCYQAIELNRRILEDCDYARWQRQRCESRLRANWYHLFSGSLEQINDEICETWPRSIRDLVRPVMIEEREFIKQRWQQTGQGCV